MNPEYVYIYILNCISYKVAKGFHIAVAIFMYEYIIDTLYS